MEGGLPAPTIRLFRREACVLVPSFVEELVGAVRQIAPRKSGNRIDYLPKSCLRLLQQGQRICEGFVRSLSLDCNSCDMPCRLDQFEIFIVRNSCLRMRDAEGAKNFSIFRNKRLGPGRANSVSYCQTTRVVRPARIVGDIRDDYSLFRKRRSTTRASVGTDGPRCDSRRKCRWQVRTRNRQ